jgi:hypothetical protein
MRSTFRGLLHARPHRGACVCERMRRHVCVPRVLADLLAYYVWDTSNSQKNHFRSVLSGTYKARPWYVFPQLPWKVVASPDYITTEVGTPLLTDGWFKYARKVRAPHCSS